jgi:1-acyl-sn-glycerol-3-phosphate acyltransferase
VPDARVLRLSDANARPEVVQPEVVRPEVVRPEGAASPVRVVGDDERAGDVATPPQVTGTDEQRSDEEVQVEGPEDETIDLTEASMRRAEAQREEAGGDGMQVARDWADALAALEQAAAGLARTTGQDDLGRLGAHESTDWERKLAGALAFLRRRLTGDYEVDEFGFDPDLTEHVLATALRPLYERWFRVETRGMENLPDEGSGLVVANHSGTVPLDAMMTTLAIYDHHPAHRHLRMLGADLVFQVPFLAPLARKAGNTLACQADAERLLSDNQLVGVWPEGFKGIGKPYSERYKLQRFGRGGFVASALRTGAPIIPCSIVGAEETYPMIGNLKTLARVFGLPYLPVTPTFPLLGPLGLVPLPSKWIIEFGEPVETASYGAAAADDPMTVFNLTDQVRETIQGSLYKLLMQRRSVFF